MKKTYETPKVEKLEFDYSDTVVASGNSNTPTDNPDNQYWLGCTCDRTYYSGGWGQQCS